MFPNSLYVKKYTVSLETINHNLHKNDNEIKESYSPQGTELVVADIEYNVDSVGLINKELNSFVIRENNTLRFLQEASKINPDLIELNFQQYIGTTFANVSVNLKSLLTEGFVDTQNNVTFRLLGHTTDSFYFYVENDIIYELTGDVDYINGVIYNTNIPLNVSVKVYGLLNITKVNCKELGQPSSKYNRSSFYRKKYNLNSNKIIIDYVTDSDEYVLTVQNDVFVSPLNLAIIIDGVLVNLNNTIYLPKGIYHIAQAINTSAESYSDFSNLISDMQGSYYADFRESTSTSYKGVQTNVLYKPNANTGISVYYIDQNTINATEEIYLYFGV